MPVFLVFQNRMINFPFVVEKRDGRLGSMTSKHSNYNKVYGCAGLCKTRRKQVFEDVQQCIHVHPSFIDIYYIRKIEVLSTKIADSADSN